MDEEVAAVTDDLQAETAPKEVRRRKKKLYQTILKQMEFYFSDANVTKDRFLGKLLQKDKYVDLAIFLSFNKIRCHTSSVDDIAKALKKSTMLSVSEDGTKVCRVTPIREKENEEDCTIYVEQLPPDADHDWLKGIFSVYGKVAYVSIPKYKPSKKIKGFGFVEFETAEEANKTLEAFGAMGCCLPTQMPPEQLCSITTFENKNDEENSTNNGHAKEEGTETYKNEPVEGTPDEERVKAEPVAEKAEKLTKKKRKRNKESLEEDGEGKRDVECAEANADEIEVPSKRSKRKREEPEQINDTTEANNDQLHSNSSEKDGDKILEKRKKKKEAKHVEVNESHVSSITDIEQGEANSRKKKRKHNQEAESDHLGSQSGNDDTDMVPEKQLKIEESEDEGGCRKNMKVDASEAGEDEETQGVNDEVFKKKKNRKQKKKSKKDKMEMDGSRLGLRILPKREWKRLRNKYLDLQRSKMRVFKQYLAKNRWGDNKQDWTQGSGDGPKEVEEMESAPVPSAPRVSFSPGIIIHVQLDAPVEDVKKFKGDAKVYPDVKYVDINEGDSEAYLRCSTSEAAQQLVSEKPWKEMAVLEGDTEAAYWDKIKRDREEKFGKKVRVKQRGRDKLLKKAETELGKHMRFDE